VQHFWSLSVQGLGLSLLYSVELTATDQPPACFHGLTRLCEFGPGALLALYVSSPGGPAPAELPRRVRVLLGWTGVVGLLVCGLVFQRSTLALLDIADAVRRRTGRP
jgi:peptidoglycan/LPS O-acetylase OafA/YrhL